MGLFDEINDLSQDGILDIDAYFEEMDLSDEEKEKRKQLSTDFVGIMILYFALISVMRKYDSIDLTFASKSLEKDYLKIVAGYVTIDEYMRDYAKRFSTEVTDTTLRNVGDKYWLSKERAVLISANEANTAGNYGQYSRAIKKGKSRKIWLAEADRRVRASHKEVDRIESPIDQPFYVGGSLMMFPKDSSMGASADQIINCRCVVEYF